jgi:hypothetical protein
MATGLLTISSVGGPGPNYTLTVVDSTGAVIGDHVVAPLLSDDTEGGIYRVTNVPDGTTIHVQDDLNPVGGTYGAPDAGPGGFWTPTVLGLSVGKATGIPFWGDITERDLLILENTASVGMKAEAFSYSDTTNKVLGPLVVTPSSLTELTLWVILGPIQEEGVDFTVREVSGGVAPGFYICVSTTSTAPGGGSFISGVNPGTGIDSVLVFGDKTRAIYPA